MMEKYFSDLQNRVKKEQRDVVKFAKHLVDELNQRKEKHRILTATEAVAGIKPNKEEEIWFYENINQMQKMILNVLEMTVEDFEHDGDKFWDKHFRDGVKE